MPTDESWRRFLDAGALIGQVSMARAEEISRGLLSEDEAIRRESWRDLEEMGRVGRKMGEQFVTLARAELAKQLEGVGSFDQRGDRLGDLLKRGSPSDAGRPAPGDDTAFSDLLDAPAPGPARAKKQKQKKKEKDGAAGKNAKAKKNGKGGKKQKKKEKASAPAGGAEGAKLLTLTRPDASAAP